MDGNDKTPPSAAEVIAACEAIIADRRQVFGECDHEVGICNCDMDKALASIAAWEAAQR